MEELAAAKPEDKDTTEIGPLHSTGGRRAARFKRVTPKRLERAIIRVRSLAQCAKRGWYGYSKAQAEYVVHSMEIEVAALRNAFLPVQPEKLKVQLPD